jgi:uncharacterized protein (TIGR02217 family)
MSFLETRLLDRHGYGISGGPGYKTTVIAAGSGAEQRVGQWAHARARYSVPSGILKAAAFADILAAFHACQGRLHGFRFKDRSDYQVTAAEDLVEISSTTFQLVKRYTAAGQTRVRTIAKPVAGTVKVWDGITEITAGWTIDTTTGIVTFAEAPIYTPAWTGEFDVPVRFDTDAFDVSHEDFDVRVWSDIPIVEVRL